MAKTALRRGSQDEGNSEYFTGCPIGGGFMWFGLITKIPTNCRVCDNSTLAIASFAKLNENLGGAWGTSGGNLNIPDLRGKFPRGVDGGAANDLDRASRTNPNAGGNTGDAVGTSQNGANASHFHYTFNTTEATVTNTPTLRLTASEYPAALDNTGVGYSSYNIDGTATPATVGKNSDSGGNESRPINAAVYFVIRVS
jgi:microcystin-dependent protein